MKLRWNAFRCAFDGIAYLVKTQPHARLHLLITVLVIALGFVFSVTRWEWIALLLAMALVWVAEAVNTAIELTCDAVSEELRPIIGHAKDVAAGAVLIAAFFAIVVGIMVFWPYLRSV
ncbi:diacylglycerol kinase family protein [soil metagenome]